MLEEPEDPPPPQLDVPADGPIGEQDCGTLTDSAVATLQPADILLVVDNSPSMYYEANAVQEQLNGFSQQIVDAGIDIRMFLLTSYPNPNASPSVDTGICVEPPLGGGGCPGSDNNPPVFSHLQATIGSSTALTRLLDKHDTWGQIVRPDSNKHVMVVSDDDSYMPSEQFDAELRALDPSYEDYVFHAITPLQDCQWSAAVGQAYIELAEMTGGIAADLCAQDFQPVFDLLSTEVVEGADVACEFDLPEPPDGYIYANSIVEADIDGQIVTVEPIASADECEANDGGWYFDQPAGPSQIRICEETCDSFREASAATVEIDLGCGPAPVG